MSEDKKSLMQSRMQANMKRWHNPPKETIKLLSGESIQHEVNGKSLDGKSGHAFVNGREIKVEWFDGIWYEQVEQEK